MVFSSFLFLTAFLPVFLAIYHASPARAKNAVALAASVAFYAWGAPTLVFYLVAACFLDYLAAAWILRSSRPRLVLGSALVLNLSLLAWFKYANFFVPELNRLLAWAGAAPVPWTSVALPIGISFFTFHRISYLVDVYRRTCAPARSFPDYLLYILLFPQLIAGPIVRYKDVAAEISGRVHTLPLFFEGMVRFSTGLAKKILVANILGETADRVFALPPASLSVDQAWVGILCYAFQIYFDFSGYSDMASGLARMVGIGFPENFNHPYAARSITEFWRRWHISLSSFMKDYLYVPLGGNRHGARRTTFNLWLVFLVSGLWHGAAWNFVAWGAYHGCFLAVERVVGQARLARIPRVPALLLTFLIVLFGWVLFRSPDLASAVAYAGRLIGLGAGVPAEAPPPWLPLLGNRAAFTLVLAALLSFAPAWDLRSLWRLSGPGADRLRFVAALAGCLLSLAYLGSSRSNPFIYFRF